MRLSTVRLALAVVALAVTLAPGTGPRAQPNDLPVFDTHIHYSMPDWSEYPEDRILGILQQAGIRRALVSSTPDDGTIKLHGPDGFEGMRRAGQLAASILDAIVPLMQPGVTTAEIDDKVRELTLAGGAVPATLGYRGYTHSCCISINHVVCHGIPGDKALKDGDIVNVDVTPLLDGWHGDSSRM